MIKQKAGSLKMNTALEYSTRVVQEGGRRCKKSTLNDLVFLTPLRIPLMNPPKDCGDEHKFCKMEKTVDRIGILNSNLTPTIFFSSVFYMQQHFPRPCSHSSLVSNYCYRYHSYTVSWLIRI
jgi:hypothetical protein